MLADLLVALVGIVILVGFAVFVGKCIERGEDD